SGAEAGAQTADRTFLAATSRLLPRAIWTSFLGTPVTLLRCPRCLVARGWTYRRRARRPPIRAEVRALILRLARDSPRWGYQWIVGELKGLGIPVAATTVRNVRRETSRPAGKRPAPSWREFLQA